MRVAADGGRPDEAVLLDGLRGLDPRGSQLGIYDAELIDGPTGLRHICLTLAKPEKTRTPNESHFSRHLFDPEVALLITLYSLVGGVFGLDYSQGENGDVYHYPSLTLPGHPFVRFHRLVVDAQAYEIALANPLNFHDWRRSRLGRSRTQMEARRLYGKQKSGRYRTRFNMNRAAVQMFPRDGTDVVESRAEYLRLIGESYRLLDRKKLGRL